MRSCRSPKGLGRYELAAVCTEVYNRPGADLFICIPRLDLHRAGLMLTTPALLPKTSMLKKMLPFAIFKSINYFGHKIKLRKLYFGEVSYALDSENIPMAEAYRLEKIMEQLPFGPNFVSKEELRESFVNIRFPGYGAFYANQLHGHPEQNLELMSVVIPRTGKDRYLVVEKQPDGGFTVVADFTAEASGVVRVRARDSSLDFLSRSGDVIFVKPRSARA